MIKLSRKYVKLQLELKTDVAKIPMFEIPEGVYSFMDLVDLIQNTELYLENQRPNRISCYYKKDKLLEMDNYRCVECGSEGDLELHHIIPVAKGGGNDDDNLQVLCKQCHHRKHRTHA